MKKVLLLCISAILILLIWLIPAVVTFTKNIPKPAYGEAVEFTEKMDGFIHVDQILHDENHIYLLDAFEGCYLRIFDTDGNYITSFVFSDMQNGTYRIALEDGILYVRDPKRGLQFYKDGAFEGITESERKDKLIESLNFNTESDTYKSARGGIWKYSNETEHKVIDIPWYSFLANPTTGAILMILYMLVIMGLRLPGIIKKNKEKLPLES